MWIFLTRRLRQWLVLAVAVPAVLAVVRMVRTRLERRSGQTGVTRALRRVEDLGGRVTRRRRRTS